MNYIINNERKKKGVKETQEEKNKEKKEPTNKITLLLRLSNLQGEQLMRRSLRQA
jgi:hypothetical protein